MVVSTVDRSRDAYTPGSPTPKGVLSMLNQSTTFAFGDSRLPARFWDKIRVLDNGCWEWMAALVDGYGQIGIGSRTDDTSRQVYSHRYAYEQLVADVPAGLQCDHLCRNRACVNPGHLEVVTCRDNILRGNGPAARQARRTHCPYGHKYSPANTYRYKRHRGCRKCIKARWQRKKSHA